MEEFLNSIGISGNFTKADDGCLTLDIATSDDYGKIFSKLERCDSLEADDDASQTTYESSAIQYINDKYTVTLLADFDNNSYRLAIREN